MAVPREPGSPFPVPLPMKATAGGLPEGDGWWFEPKWDGMRVLARAGPAGVVLFSSNGREVTDSFPELAGLAGATDGHEVVLDGEVVALGPDGRPDFGLLTRRIHQNGADRAARLQHQVPVVYEIFDLLALDGRSLMASALEQRRAHLEQVIGAGPAWALSPIETDGAALWAAVTELGLEGVVAKKVDSHYRPGRRGNTWRKTKVRHRQEVVVGGWTPGRGTRTGTLGALVVGVQDGGSLREAGRVGSGIGPGEAARLVNRLAPLARATCPFDPPPRSARTRDARWVEPEVVVEVAFAGWTAQAHLRHPSYVGERFDKDPGEVVRED